VIFVEGEVTPFFIPAYCTIQPRVFPRTLGTFLPLRIGWGDLSRFGFEAFGKCRKGICCQQRPEAESAGASESIRVNSRLKFLDSVRKWAYLGNQNNFASFRKNWMNIEAALKNLDNQ
jgi:hypothetical protein